MFASKRPSPTLVNVCDFNTLYVRDRNANLNTKNYLSSKSPVSSIFSRNLRLVVTNGVPSDILVLPKTISPIPKKEVRKYHKQTTFDVYRSLARTSSYSERDLTNDNTNDLSGTFTVDRISPLSNTGFFRINHLPKIARRTSNANESSKSRNKVKNIEYIRSPPLETFPQTTPNSDYYDEEKEKITTTTTPPPVLTCMSNDQTRKQLHVYMPAINC